MIRQIGEIFEWNGVKLKVVKCPACDGCYFQENGIACGEDNVYDVTSDCSIGARNYSVIFKEVK